GYQSSDIIFKDYREFIPTIKLSDLKYSLEYEAIISLSVPKDEFDSSFLGELARDEDLYHIYPYFIYLNHRGDSVTNTYETDYLLDSKGNIIVTPNLLKDALEHVSNIWEGYDEDYSSSNLFINNRVNVIKEKVVKEKYHYKERMEEADEIVDFNKRISAIGRINNEFERKEEAYLSKNASALALIVRQENKASEYRDMHYQNYVPAPTYYYYYFDSCDKYNAKKLGRSLRKENDSISDMWLYYIDKNGHKYEQASEHIFSKSKYCLVGCPSISVEERIKLYNLFEENINFPEYNPVVS
ncbi:MAG: hypothetical protein LUC16_03300, partial [Coprobacillus sp.]|nr:hypothetical protein [Coprobacillus sp.]